jgi:hypothetical protein
MQAEQEGPIADAEKRVATEGFERLQEKPDSLAGIQRGGRLVLGRFTATSR